MESARSDSEDDQGELERIAADFDGLSEPKGRKLIQIFGIEISISDPRSASEIVHDYRYAIAKVMADKALDAATGIGRRAAEVVYGVQLATDKIKDLKPIDANTPLNEVQIGYNREDNDEANDPDRRTRE